MPTFEEVMAEPYEPDEPVQEAGPRQSATFAEAWERVKAALPIEVSFGLSLNVLMKDEKDSTPWVASADTRSKAHYLQGRLGSCFFGATEIEALDQLAARLESVEHR
jgi:hypothetical protein